MKVNRKPHNMNHETLLQSNIVDILGLSRATKEEREREVGRAADIILESVIDRIEDGLSADKRSEFEYAFRDGTTEEERQAFLDANVPNMEQIVLAETLRFKRVAQVMKPAETA